jgi:hypothetical protein
LKNKPRKRVTAALILVVVAFGLFALTRHVSSKRTPPVTEPSPTNPAGAPTSAAYSHGVYIANFFAPADPKLLANPDIDGSSQAYKWNTLEPSKGAFDWSRLDSDLKRAQTAAKRISLGIDTGALAPAWAKPQALSFIISPHQGKFALGQKVVIPIPWDPTYEANVRDLADAVAAHLHSTGLYGVVAQVKLTGITEETEETRMPAEGPIPVSSLDGSSVANTFTTDATAVWHSHGYTRTLVENAWKTMAGYWAAAFPDKTLALPTIMSAGFPNIDANGVVLPGKDTTTSRDLVDYGARTWGKRFMSMHTSLSDLYTSANQWLQIRAYGEGASVGYQFDALQFGHPGTTAEPKFLAGANIGLQLHMTYVEVFRPDPGLYPTTVARLHAALR